jgi:hypothetical protein
MVEACESFKVQAIRDCAFSRTRRIKSGRKAISNRTSSHPQHEASKGMLQRPPIDDNMSETTRILTHGVQGPWTHLAAFGINLPW